MLPSKPRIAVHVDEEEDDDAIASGVETPKTLVMSSSKSRSALGTVKKQDWSILDDIKRCAAVTTDSETPHYDKETCLLGLIEVGICLLLDILVKYICDFFKL